MRNILRIAGTLLCAAVLPTVSCEAPTTAGSGGGREERFLSVMTWNLQALFDGEESGNEYGEYRDGWTAEKYQGRLTAIGQAVGEIESGPPDVIAFVEVENEAVLAALADGPLAAYGYAHRFFAATPPYSLGVGVLSCFPITQARAHSAWQDGEVTPRPAAEVWITPQGERGPQGGPIALFVCHWKSKLGGEAATEIVRQQAARIVVRRLREIGAADPGTPVIVTGDLNENYDEFYRRGGESVCALMPDVEAAAAAAGEAAHEAAHEVQEDFLVLSERKPPEAEHFGADTVSLYSPWAEMEAEGIAGSYYYGDGWETIDHFLLSAPLFDGAGWEYFSCARADGEPFTGPSGYPRAYNPRTGAGLSDHLPLLLMLEFTPEPAPASP